MSWPEAVVAIVSILAGVVTLGFLSESIKIEWKRRCRCENDEDR